MLESLSTYRLQATHYLENARLALEAGEMEKAGEFLWGSMAEAVKATAAQKGQLLQNHGVLRRYAKQLARELQDPTLEAAYIRAEQLHINFYEVFLRPDELAREYEVIGQAVSKLLDLPPEVDRRGPT